ncbi:ATP-dependent metalloprotease [Cryptococcus neoformans]|nr:ATP-dependent metalloprotease [Cryptococcus neoformans var. grubii c45]OXB34576.1 ATP-dependent metalloprotease [Cryptococcus neoformans var. grubii]OXC58672.1 ATP-dependent metalloprotease [Cryptococcus neoformans var. grubii MW-RSA852]
MLSRSVQAAGLDLFVSSRTASLSCQKYGARSSSNLKIPRKRSQVISLPCISSRALHSSASWNGIFSSRSTTAKPSETQTDVDQPLTPFQARIAELEIKAHANKEDPDAQLEFLRQLSEGGEFAGLVAYYEGMALAEDTSGSRALLRNDEAWGIFMDALARSGRLGDIVAMVRRRDQLLASIGANGASSPSTHLVSNTTPPSASANNSSISTSSVTSPGPSLTSSLLSRAMPPTSLANVSNASTSQSHPGAGSPLNPIYVQMAPPTPQMNAWRALRWVAGFLLWGFIILTVMSMVIENTGLLKAGPGPVEFEPEEGKIVKFSDVHGVEEAKAELEEIVEFLKNPEKFSALGGKLPKGVLLTGPPGTGKTMLARAVAGEAEVPFLFASGSSFDEMFVGVGAKRVRELFAAARKKAPAIIFIDELDAIGSKRSAKDQHYMKQTLNQLLVELDGFEQAEGVIIIAATNFPESLDKALTRPGRFDRHVVVGLPDVRGRIEILKHHMSEVQYDVDVDPSVIARGCPGMSGADLQNLVNQAAVKASRDGSNSVQLKHFEWAKDRILMGAERRSHYVTEESKRATAYHEGGHALVALHTPGAMPLHKVTIMPRGQALGITFQLPEQDKDSYTRREFNAMIDVALGGRAAEEMIFGHDNVTSGCSSDLQRATDVATRMIRNYGFSDKVGLVAHGDEESVYLSSKKKDEIESEIRSFLDQSMTRTENLLKSHEDELHRLADALIEYETLSLDEVKQVLEGKRLNRPTTEGESLKGQGEKNGKGPIVDGI